MKPLPDHDSRNTEWVKSLQDAVTPRKLESGFRWVTYSGAKNTKPTVYIGSLGEFVDQVFDPSNLRASKYDCPLFQCIEIKDGATRGNAAVESHTALVIDYDEGLVPMSVAVEFLRSKGFLSILYRSFTSPEDGTKFRVIIPTLRYLDSAEMRVALARVNRIFAEINVRVSSESYVPGQAFFFGFDKRLAGQPGLTEVVGDRFLDTDAPDFIAIPPLFPVLVEKENDLRRRLFPDEVEAEIIAMVELAGGKLGTGEGRTELLKGYLVAVKRQNPNLQDEAALTKEAARIVDQYFVNPETMQPERLVDWVLRTIDFEPRTRDIAQAFKDAPEDDSSPNPGAKKKMSFQETEVIFGDSEEPIEYIVDGFFESGVGVLAGAPGGGKTNAMVPFSLIAAGLLEAPGLKAEVRRKVVYISEHPSQVGRILKSIKRANPGIDKAELRDWFKVFPSARRSLSEVAKILEVVKAEYSYTDACGYLVRPLVIFDTASACFNLENENDNSQVAEVIATLKAANIPILVVAHTPKALKRADLDQLTVRGGGAWEGDAHQVFFLFEDEAIGRRVIGISKVRFLPAFWEIHFGLSEPFDEIVEVPWDGQAQRVTFVHGVPEIGSREERQEARAELAEERRDDKKEKAILEKMGQVLSVVESTVGRGAWISRGLLREVIGGRTETLVTVISRLVGAGSVEEIEIPESIHKSGGTKPKALIPAGLNQESYWARVAEIARGKAGT